jgi:hypothetical protein
LFIHIKDIVFKWCTANADVEQAERIWPLLKIAARVRLLFLLF